MAKTKLTLYIDKEIGVMAKKSARLSGKSISTLVKEYFVIKNKQTNKIEIPESIYRWIGIMDNIKTYKELRDNYIDERLEKYEDIN
ncbi:MAG: hypothetical protein HY934_03535 [Candidatus Firestonebacteria bacterium]|nr:hypothetical protein [Candidatus Firestonebacteria bacterium]